MAWTHKRRVPVWRVREREKPAEEEDFLLLSSCVAEGVEFMEHKLPGEFPYVDSAPSPVESVISSTESDEDDMLALTRLMGRSNLVCEGQDLPQKFGELASSPQSTLCSERCWSQPSSTLPVMPNNPRNERLELTYPVYDQLAGVNVGDEESTYLRGLLGVARKLSADGFSQSGAPTRNPDLPRHPPLRRCWSDSNRNSSAVSLQLEMLTQQHQLSLWREATFSEAQLVRGGVRPTTTKADYGCSLGLSYSRSPLQINNPNGSVRPVFLGNSGSRRESSGTGVFLPRTAGNPSDFRKKSCCSTVLLPARVVQALNLHVEDVGATQPSYYLGRLFHGPDPSINISPPPFVAPRNGFLPPHKRFARPQLAAGSNHLHLPQEWSYY